MRRILSLVLAVAILLSVALAGGFSVSAESALTASDECISILKKYEGFSATPYWDYAQWTVGYGTKCPSDMVDYYKANGITEEEAEVLLRNYVAAYEKDINGFADRYSLTFNQGQFDALILFSYNCGSGWVYSPSKNFHKTMAKGDATAEEILYWFGTWSNAGGVPNTALIRRRICEADMYLNGNYSVSTPEHYGYVIYNANGGSVSDRVHTYNSDAEQTISIVPTYKGYTFDGWYTDKSGGTKVTKLDESTDGMTLYAHWSGDGSSAGDDTADDDTTTESVEQETIESITVTVTANHVNLRKGPGTNYATIGQANTGDKLDIVLLAVNGDLIWGGYDGGWICLQYTNFEQVLEDMVEQETPSEPEATEPEPTEPEPTEPEPTEPEPTEPEPTEPETTEPEQTKKTTGKVKVNGYLNVRSGPGTGYGAVGQLKNGEAVEILEQKTVGSMVWGKTSKGWISMSYVVLDSDSAQTQPEINTGTSGSQTSSVSGAIKVSGSLNIRSGPGTSYGIVGSYYNGDKVTVTEQKTVGSVTWGKTGKGWISMNYFTTQTAGESSGTTGESGNTAGSTGTAGTVKVDGMLRIRSGPGTSYAVAGYLYNGDKVTITEQKTVGSTTWGKTAKGWISMDYVVLSGSGSSGESGSTAVIRTVTANCLNVRSGAGTGNSVVGYLYAGTKVEILEQKTVDGVLWGKVANGWISLEYTK